MYFGSEMLDLRMYLPACISVITSCNSVIHTRIMHMRVYMYIDGDSHVRFVKSFVSRSLKVIIVQQSN